MGQKVNPYGFRLGFNKTWHSRWFAGKTYAETLHRDLNLEKGQNRKMTLVWPEQGQGEGSKNKQ